MTLEDVITEWARNIWLINHPQENAADFDRAFFGTPRNLNTWQKFSERSLTAYFLTADRLLDGCEPPPNKLVDAWTKSVMKTNFQHHYSFFEKEAYALIKAQGTEPVIRAYPVRYNGADVAKALRDTNYKSPMLTIPVIIGFINKASRNPPAAPGF